MSSIQSSVVRVRELYSSGVTLLEMMVAVAASMLLMLLLTRIYMNMHHVLASQHAMQVQQNNALRLIDIIREEVGVAGHIGCARLSREFIVHPLSSYSLNVDNFLEVNPKNITVRYQAFPSVVLLKDSHDRSALIADASIPYRPGEILVIADCLHAEIFQASDVVVRGNIQLITPKNPVRYQYHQYAEIGLLVIRQYYLRRDHTLMRREVDGRKTEILRGVNDLKFERDAGGIRFSFQTIDEKFNQNWQGYAAIR